jgi:hypothetical protein
MLPLLSGRASKFVRYMHETQTRAAFLVKRPYD